jgi:hypothetical protein
MGKTTHQGALGWKQRFNALIDVCAMEKKALGELPPDIGQIYQENQNKRIDLEWYVCDRFNGLDESLRNKLISKHRESLEDKVALINAQLDKWESWYESARARLLRVWWEGDRKFCKRDDRELLQRKILSLLEAQNFADPSLGVQRVWERQDRREQRKILEKVEIF